ncbi:MAG: hypothetical protein KC731_25455 [Myxococcales bacterium]|nr:hypothetical protein [Myxococcales bacterium]
MRPRLSPRVAADRDGQPDHGQPHPLTVDQAVGLELTEEVVRLDAGRAELGSQEGEVRLLVTLSEVEENVESLECLGVHHVASVSSLD